MKEKVLHKLSASQSLQFSLSMPTVIKKIAFSPHNLILVSVPPKIGQSDPIPQEEAKFYSAVAFKLSEVIICPALVRNADCLEKGLYPAFSAAMQSRRSFLAIKKRNKLLLDRGRLSKRDK